MQIALSFSKPKICKQRYLLLYLLFLLLQVMSCKLPCQNASAQKMFFTCGLIKLFKLFYGFIFFCGPLPHTFPRQPDVFALQHIAFICEHWVFKQNVRVIFRRTWIAGARWALDPRITLQSSPILLSSVPLRAYPTLNGFFISHDTPKILQQSFWNKYMVKLRSYVRRKHDSTQFSR